MILNILEQIKNKYKVESEFSQSLLERYRTSTNLNNSKNSKSFINHSFALDTTNVKYNTLVNLEKNESVLTNLPIKSGLIPKRVCNVNGTDHSLSPFKILSREERKIFIMPKNCFFN